MQVWEDAMMVALSCALSKERVVWQSLPIRIMLFDTSEDDDDDECPHSLPYG